MQDNQKNQWTTEQIAFYTKYKRLWKQIQEFINTDLFKEFKIFIENKISKTENIKDIDISKMSDKEIINKVIYKQAEAEAYKSILKFIHSISNIGQLSESRLKKIERMKEQ